MTGEAYTPRSVRLSCWVETIGSLDVRALGLAMELAEESEIES